jgi:Holliday junction resolvase
MPVLKNSRHERFAQLRASGKTGCDAYREAVSNKSKNPDVLASQLVGMPGVAERIEELKAESARKCSMTREEFVESLVEMYRSAPGDASLTNPLCDSLISRGVRHAVFPMKTTVAAQLAKLCGWESPQRLEVEAGENLSGFLGRLFTAGRTLGGNGSENGERNSSKETSGSAAIRH